MRSKKTFSVTEYGSTLAASHAAQDYAARYTRGLYPSYQPPRLFVVFDSVNRCYFITPNDQFVPALNEAWKTLLAEEHP